MRFTGAVNNDLVAAEAIYHKACHATYISKNNLYYEGRQETYYDIAFKQLPECVSTDVNGGMHARFIAHRVIGASLSRDDCGNVRRYVDIIDISQSYYLH